MSKLNSNAMPWFPSSEKILSNLDIIMNMTYEEFKVALLADSLPDATIRSNSDSKSSSFDEHIENCYKPILYRDTNSRYDSYSEWAYENRERLSKLNIYQFFESSPFSFISPKCESMDKFLEENYWKEEKQWIQENPEIFKEEEIEWL